MEEDYGRGRKADFKRYFMTVIAAACFFGPQTIKSWTMCRLLYWLDMIKSVLGLFDGLRRLNKLFWYIVPQRGNSPPACKTICFLVWSGSLPTKCPNVGQGATAIHAADWQWWEREERANIVKTLAAFGRQIQAWIRGGKFSIGESGRKISHLPITCNTPVTEGFPY